MEFLGKSFIHMAIYIYIYIYIHYTITDEGNWRLPKRLEKSFSLWASVSEQPRHNIYTVQVAKYHGNVM